MQAGVFCALYEWRDRVCREEDESGGYVLPKAQLTLLAQEPPGRFACPVDWVGKHDQRS